MKLLIVRHAIALQSDRDRWQDDSRRPLSAEGIRRARHAAAGLRELLRAPDRVLTSPLLRARQTAEILHAVADWPAAVECPELAPHAPLQALFAVLARDTCPLLALVGHQPGLGSLISACLPGETRAAAFELKKNSTACIGFKAAPRPGAGTLHWLAAPRMLREMR